MCGVRGVEDVEDLLPETAGAPLLVARVHGVPGTEVGGQFTPGGASPDDPEDPGQHGAMISSGTTHPGRRREQDCNPCPPVSGEVEIGDGGDLDGWTATGH